MNPDALRKITVTNIEVEQLLALRETQKELKRRLELVDQSVESAEQAIVSKLDSGADLTACGFGLEVKECERRYPAWKEHFIELAGKDAAHRVLAQTDPKIYRNLRIGAKKAA